MAVPRITAPAPAAATPLAPASAAPASGSVGSLRFTITVKSAYVRGGHEFVLDEVDVVNKLISDYESTIEKLENYISGTEYTA